MLLLIINIACFQSLVWFICCLHFVCVFLFCFYIQAACCFDPVCEHVRAFLLKSLLGWGCLCRICFAASDWSFRCVASAHHLAVHTRLCQSSHLTHRPHSFYLLLRPFPPPLTWTFWWRNPANSLVQVWIFIIFIHPDPHGKWLTSPHPARGYDWHYFHASRLSPSAPWYF